MQRGGTTEQQTKRRSPLVSLGALVVVLALLATACRAETELVTPAEASTVTPAPASPEPEAESEPAEPEPADPSEPEPADSDPSDSEAGASEAGDRPAAPPTDTPVLLEGFLGFSPDGRYAYDSTMNPWRSSLPCDATLREPVIGIDLARSTAAGDFVTFDAGVDLPGIVSGLYLDPNGHGALMTVCVDDTDKQESLTAVMVAPDGQLTVVGESFVFGGDALYQWVRGMVEPTVIEVEATLNSDDDGETWDREIRQIDLVSGESTTVAEIAFDDERRIERPGVTTPDGRFTYTEIDDPAGSIGCEGFGIAASIAMDDGSGPRPIFGPDQPAWASVSDMHFGPDGLVAWISSCEGYAGLNVGRILDDGTIADAHWVNTRRVDQAEDYIDFQHLRLLPDGNVVAMGLAWNDGDQGEPRFEVISLADDVGFVTTGPRPPVVDLDDPIADTIAGTGAWFVGASLRDPADSGCESMTLFASTTLGLVHGVASPEALGQIVEAYATPPVSFDVDYGGPTGESEPQTITRRTMVVVTECADEYIGRKVWFGDEPEIPGYGIWLDQADLPSVAEVLSVREEPHEGGSPWAFDVVAEVVFRDGTQAEVILEPVPYAE